MHSQNVSYKSGVSISAIDLLKQAKELMGSDYFLFVAICAVGIIIGGAVPLNILLGPMLCGIYLAFFAKMRNEPAKFEMLFKGFDHFKDSLIAALVQLAAVVVVMIPLWIVIFGLSFVLGMAMGDSAVGGILMLVVTLVGYLVVFLATIGVQVCTMFAFPLIVEHKMEGMDAIKLSYAAGRANLKSLIIYGLIVGILAGISAMLCVIPMFFFLPMMFGANLLVYRLIFDSASAQATAPPPPTMPSMDPPPPPPSY